MHAKLLAIPAILAITLLLCRAGTAADPPFPTTLVFPPYFHSYGIQRATEAKLFMLLPMQTRFSNPQGLAVTKMRTRDDTTTEKDDDEVTVYGVNSGRGEIIYNTSMYGLALWGKKGGGKEEMRDPVGVACDEEGNVYICDTGNDRIVRLFNPMKKVRFVGHLGVGALRRPTHLVLDGKGVLYVSDSGNDRIAVLDRDGNLVREIRQAGPVSVSSPSGLALNMVNERWRYYRANLLFFLNRGGRELVRLNLDDGSAVVVRPSRLLKLSPSYEFMASDYYANLYLTDPVRGTIDKYDYNLNYIVSFGKSGSRDREFEEPRGICIWKRYGQTLVAEKSGAQYYWVGTDFSGISLVVKKAGACLLKGRLTEQSFLSLYYVRGADTLETIFKKRRAFPGALETAFRIRSPLSEDGCLLFAAEPTYSSYTYFIKSERIGLGAKP